MSADPCRREDELLDALQRGYVGPELAAHVAACPACGELHAVAGALLDDRSAALAAAPVPAAGTMWWRMRLRHRREAEATARRSLLVGQALTLAVAVALLVAFFGAELVEVGRGLAATLRVHTVLALALGALGVLAPLAGWIAVRQR
jgi:hypothetical protein